MSNKIFAEYAEAKKYGDDELWGLYGLREMNISEERINELYDAYSILNFKKKVKGFEDFASDEERIKYLEKEFDGATLEELLDIGIDPFEKCY